MKCCLCHEDKPEPWIYICNECSAGIMAKGPYEYLTELRERFKVSSEMGYYCTHDEFDDEFDRRYEMRGIGLLPTIEDREEASAWLSLELAVELRAPAHYLGRYQGVLHGNRPAEYRTRKLSN